MSQIPSVGRIVHYVSHGTPLHADGTQDYTSQCRAAIITEVTNQSTIGLCVLNPTGSFFNRDVLYDDGAEKTSDPNCPDRAAHGNPFRYCSCGWMEATYKGGSWHWPERVE